MVATTSSSRIEEESMNHHHQEIVSSQPILDYDGLSWDLSNLCIEEDSSCSDLQSRRKVVRNNPQRHRSRREREPCPSLYPSELDLQRMLDSDVSVDEVFALVDEQSRRQQQQQQQRQRRRHQQQEQRPPQQPPSPKQKRMHRRPSSSQQQQRPGAYHAPYPAAPHYGFDKPSLPQWVETSHEVREKVYRRQDLLSQVQTEAGSRRTVITQQRQQQPQQDHHHHHHYYADVPAPLPFRQRSASSSFSSYHSGPPGLECSSSLSDFSYPGSSSFCNNSSDSLLPPYCVDEANCFRDEDNHYGRPTVRPSSFPPEYGHNDDELYCDDDGQLPPPPQQQPPVHGEYGRPSRRGRERCYSHSSEPAYQVDFYNERDGCFEDPRHHHQARFSDRGQSLSPRRLPTPRRRGVEHQHHRGSRRQHQPEAPGSNGAQQASSSPLQVEVSPGYHLPLRGSDETLKAVEEGYAASVQCFACDVALWCVPDCEMVICPDCRVISPITTSGITEDRPRRGVGLGLRCCP